MPNYAVIEEDATAGTDPQELINIFSVGGASRGYIYDLLVSSGATPDDQAANYDVIRTTAVGTENAGFTPVKLDPDTGASTFDGGVSHTAAPTQTANSEMMVFSVNQRATFRWIAAPGGDFVMPATTNNGILVTRRTSTAAYVIDCTVHFRE
jgi:hypothetical protein